MINLDTPLYRYLSADRFIEMVFSKSLAVINPSLWVDSYEIYWLNLLKTPEGKALLFNFVKGKSAKPEADTEKIMKLCQFSYDRSFCLCFSAVKDAEVLWSAKADSKKCVMIETTARQLLDLLPDDENCTIERVQYDLESNSIDDFLGRFHLYKDGVACFDTDQLFLHKRKCFAYEEELRLIVMPNAIPGEKVINYPIPDISKLINGVMVHPLAEARHVGLIEVICNTMQIPFWGKSQIYDFAPL